MSRISRLYSSTIGKKFIVAVTGIVLLLFLLGHVAGNLKVFTGVNSEGVFAIDEYGEFLRTAGHPLLPDYFALWSARIVLLACVVLHVVVVIQLATRNAAARPVKYARSEKVASTWPARLMMVSGLLILGFIVFHILHFTTGTIKLGDFEEGKIHHNLAQSFAIWPVSLGYTLVMLVLGFHLYHGIWSLFQTLGFDNPDRNRMLRATAMVLTVGIVVGFISVPLSFLTGLVPDAVHGASELTKGVK